MPRPSVWKLYNVRDMIYKIIMIMEKERDGLLNNNRINKKKNQSSSMLNINNKTRGHKIKLVGAF